eukprot:TRINITY_DN2455_c0_g1_i1.p1 TRINITY_DN2455_c0_g1~~TRINITY_DN2455_c0_g1_i1.p1  ORF type:complete len:436 (+),score=108.83 TRINITY_DN2455_c0_g1_i1:81-1310(+)
MQDQEFQGLLDDGYDIVFNSGPSPSLPTQQPSNPDDVPLTDELEAFRREMREQISRSKQDPIANPTPIPRNRADFINRVFNPDQIKFDMIVSALEKFSVDEKFVESFEVQYGDIHPKFRVGNLSEAIQLAKTNHKLLLIYLHHSSHELTLPFCLETLCTFAVKEYVDMNYEMWVGEIDSSVEAKTTSLFGTKEYPLFVVMGEDEGQFGLIKNIQGKLSLDEFMSPLMRTFDKYGVALREKRQKSLLETERNKESRRLRDLQEREYMESLEADRLKEFEKQNVMVDEDDDLELQAALELSKQLESENTTPAPEISIPIVRKRMEDLVAEPEKGPETCQLALRLPNGARLNRRFLQTSTIQDVVDYIEAASDIDAKFSLVMTYPRCVLADMEQTLASAGLFPQALIHVQLQ